MEVGLIHDCGGLADRGEFATTHWSVVLAACHREPLQAQAALETLCRSYWYPLYVYVRRKGHSPHDAQDLTQGFFEHLLGRDFLRRVAPEKGRFRSFLLTCLKRFLADVWRKESAAKRGAGQRWIALDGEAERRYHEEPAGVSDPEALYERRWALTLLERVLERLEEEFRAAGRQDLFNHLQPLLLGERTEQTYAELAAHFGTSPGAVKMTVLRMRERHRALFREEIASTVATPGEIDEEIRHLIAILSR